MSDALVLALGLAEPTGLAVAPFLLITGGNLLGMLCLWVVGMLVLAAARRPATTGIGSGAEAVDGDATGVVEELELGAQPAHA
jgi:hypothetical protein